MHIIHLDYQYLLYHQLISHTSILYFSKTHYITAYYDNIITIIQKWPHLNY
jgi:hypothetical protein